MIPSYDWWKSGGNEPPAHLKTQKQLAELGLKPVKAVGVIETRKYDLYLYDPNDPESAKPKRKPSAKQLAVLEKARKKAAYQRWDRDVGFIGRDRVEAVKWAREILGQHFRILDTETTGLENAEIVEIAIIDQDGKPLINTLVKPSCDLEADAIAVHGITDLMVKDAPTLPEIWGEIIDAIAHHPLLIYNAEFDLGILNYCSKHYNLPKLKINADCVMAWYSQWRGDWSDYHKDYRWQPLNGSHRALGDCQATLARIEKIAADSDKIKYPEWIEP